MDSASEISFTVPGKPMAFARAGSKGKFRFTPAPQRQAMGILQVIAAEAMAGRPPFSGPVAMTITAVWAWPKSLNPRKRSALGANYRTARPDSDTVAKLICDAINGIVFLDDAQVCDLRVRKLFGESSFVRVQIETLAGEGGA